MFKQSPCCPLLVRHCTTSCSSSFFSVLFSLSECSPPEVLDRQTEMISHSSGRPPYILISVLAVNTVNSHIINDPNILGTKKLICQCHQTYLNRVWCVVRCFISFFVKALTFIYSKANLASDLTIYGPQPKWQSTNDVSRVGSSFEGDSLLSLLFYSTDGSQGDP